MTSKGIGVSTDSTGSSGVTISSDDPNDGSLNNQSINALTSDRQSMQKLVKPEIPAKTFIKTNKKVMDNSSHISTNSNNINNSNNNINNDINNDINGDHNEPINTSTPEEVVKTSSDEELNKNYEKSVNNVDEVFATVFGKSVTISDKINEIVVETEPEESDPITSEYLYSDTNNPFGEEDDEEEEETHQEHNEKVVLNSPKISPEEYPEDKNPFDDEDVEEKTEEVPKTVANKQELNRRPSDALNPFCDDEDIEEDNNYSTPKPKPRQSLTVSAPSSAVPSPTSSLRSRKKKRPAPTPPNPGIPQVNSSCSLNSSFAAVSEDSSRRDSLISSVSSDLNSSVPNSRTPTPLPRHRLQKSNEELIDGQQINDKISDQNSSLRSVDSDSDLKKTPTTDLKVKKRPAPPIPAVKRIIKGSLAEIEDELNLIGDKLPSIEKRGKELEEILTKRLEDQSSEGQPTVINENDPTMNEFLSTARERCRLARRQKELMYMKREHKLEEIQADIEYQMRCVISKQAAQKTEEDLKKEEELLQRLVEIIEERNVIIENMVDDENKEVEEYRRIVSKVMPTKVSISGQTIDPKKEEIVVTKHKTIDKNFIKFKDKLKLKDIKEKKKMKKLEKMEKTGEKADKSSEKTPEKSSENLKSKSKESSGKHLTLKSTLKPLKKSLGLKSSSDQKKADKSQSPVVSVQTNGSNASISDKK